MEALGAASSVAGILSLVGQSIDGIIKLRGFVKDVKNASKTLDNFLRDVDSFQGSLSQIQQLLVQLPKEQSIVTAQLDLQSLNWQLKTCRDDIKEWLHLANSLDLGSSGRIETFFKKLRVAVNKDGFSEFHRQIGRHQRGLNISLSVLGPSVTLLGLDHIETLCGRFADFEEEQSGRHIQLTQTLETNISRFATQESISNAISEKVDPVRDWMETSIKSPLARWNDAVQDNANFSKMHFHETRAMSASISSFGSQLSQQSEQIQEIRKLVENLGTSHSQHPGATGSITSMNSYSRLSRGDISPQYSPMQGPQEARGTWSFSGSDPPVRSEAYPRRVPSLPVMVPVKQSQYSCGAVLGIEESFVRERCVYCGLTFNADSDWKLRGKHLVEDHSFNKCDAEIFYNTWDAYFKHLTTSHRATDFVCCSRETSTFLRPQADLRQLSREVSNVFLKAFEEDNELQQWLTDNEYNLNCKQSQERDLVLLDLRHAIQRLSEIDLGLGAQCLSDFTQEALNLLWEIDWQICCAKERCIVNELHFLLESDQLIEVWNDKWPIFPAATSPTTKLEVYKTYVSQIQLHCPIGPQTLVEFKIRLRKILDSTDEDVARVFGSQLSKLDMGKVLLQTKDFPISLPEAMDVSVCQRKRIDEWLFQIFGVSYTSRILISYHSEIRCPGRGGALDWMLQNIVHWTLEASENDLLLPISDGAIDSRDDLVSVEIKFGARHRDLPPPLPPPRFLTDIAQHEDGWLDHVWKWGKPLQEDGDSSLLYENFASRNMFEEPGDFGYAGRSGFNSSTYVKPLSVSNTQAYDKYLLQKLDSRRATNNRTPPSESRTSQGGYMNKDAPLRRRSRRSFSPSSFLHPRLMSPSRSRTVSQNELEKAGRLAAASGFKSHTVFICECCPLKPKKFDTREELNIHGQEKQYECACMEDVLLPQPTRLPHTCITDETRPQMLSKGEQVIGSHEFYGDIVRAHDASASSEMPVKSIEDSMSNKDSPTLYPPRPFSSRGSTSMDLNKSGHAVAEIGFLPLDKGNIITENLRKRKIDTFEDLANPHKRRRTPTAEDLEQERVEVLRLLGSPEKDFVKNSKTTTSNQGGLLKYSPVREDRQGSMPLSDTELPFRLKDEVGQSSPLHYSEEKGTQLENEHTEPFEDILKTSEIGDNSASARPAADLVHTADVPQPVVLDLKQWEGMDDESAARFRYFLCRESLKALVGKLENPPDESTAYTLTLVQATTAMMESNLRIWKRVERHL